MVQSSKSERVRGVCASFRSRRGPTRRGGRWGRPSAIPVPRNPSPGRGAAGWARSIVTYATHLLEILHELEHSLIGLLRARRGPGGGREISRGRRRRRRATEGTAATPAASVRAVPILHARAPCGGWSASRPRRRGRGSSRSFGVSRRTSQRAAGLSGGVDLPTGVRARGWRRRTEQVLKAVSV